MPRGRRRFTIGGLMILTAVCGLEASRYRREVERKAEMKLAVSITDNIYLYGMGVVASWASCWVAFSRVRAAKLAAAKRRTAGG